LRGRYCIYISLYIYMWPSDDRFKGLFVDGVLEPGRAAEARVTLEGGAVYAGGWLRGR